MSPLLFAVSVYYSEMSESFTARTTGAANIQGTDQAPGLLGAVQLGKKAEGGITPRDIYWFAIATIIMTTFFAALALGMLRDGSVNSGVKYVPIFTIVAIAIFFLFYNGLKILLKPFVG